MNFMATREQHLKPFSAPQIHSVHFSIMMIFLIITIICLAPWVDLTMTFSPRHLDWADRQALEQLLGIKNQIIDLRQLTRDY